MKMRELRELADQELIDKIEDIRVELFNLRFQKAQNRLENPNRIRVLKKDLTRIFTLQTERKSDQAESTER
ncbi:MAG: 50S ribosomal protein L29 [Candidatus Cloacimonetes bacterium]|nr:50S ribosomal protein L29 [Candidatus Cloacimonadota bacterium]